MPTEQPNKKRSVVSRSLAGMEKPRVLLAVLAALLSAVSVSVFCFMRGQTEMAPYFSGEKSSLLRDSLSPKTLLIAAVLLLFYIVAFHLIYDWHVGSVLIALLLGFNMMVSLSMEHSALREIFLPLSAEKNVLVLSGFICLCATGLELLFLLCDRTTDAICQKEEAKVRGDRLRFLLAFFAIVLCWIPGLYYCYPGSVMADTLNQIRSIAGLERITAANPILSTLVFGYLYQLGLAIGNEGLGLFMSVIVQVLLNGIAMALVAVECYRYTRSKGFYIACILFFGVNPVWQNAMQLIIKDVFHTGFFLLFCIHYLRCIREPKKSMSNVILLGLLVLIITFTRRAVYYIGVISIIVVALVHLKKYFLPYVLCLICVVGIFTFCNQVLYPMLDIQPEWESENYSMQFQQVALYCRTYQNEMTGEEKKIIDSTLDFDTIVQEYDPMISDPVKITYHGSSTDHQAFWALYRKMLFRHPGIFLKAIVMDSFEHMNPWYDSPQLRVYISEIGDYIQVGYLHDNVYDIYHYWYDWLTIPVLRLFIGTGLYMWLCAAAFGYAARKRSVRAFLGQIPTLVLFIGLFMSHVNGEIRYGYPLTAVTPLVYGWTLYAAAWDESHRAEKRVREGKDKQTIAKRKQAYSYEQLMEETTDDAWTEEELSEEDITVELPPEEPTPMEQSWKPGKVLDFVTRYIPVPKRPKTYLDFLKVLAIFLVLWNHTSMGFERYNGVLDMPRHMLYLCISIFDKIAVPLFFMASGALLLGREESWRTILKHRVRRFALILLVASAITYVYYYSDSSTFSFTDFLTRLYTDSVRTPFWYLYAYIALLLSLPFLRKLARCMREQDYLWLVIFFIVTQLLSVVDFFWFHGEQYHSSDFLLFTSQNYVVYTLMGFYLDRVMKQQRLNLETLLMLVILSVFSIGASYLLTERRVAYLGEWSSNTSQTFFNTFIAIPSITVFYLAKYWFTRRPVSGRAAAVWSLLATGTFGTYLFERYWRDSAWFVFAFVTKHLSPFAGSFIHILAACIMGILATLVYKLLTGFLKSCFSKTETEHRKKRQEAAAIHYIVPDEDISDLEEIESLLVGGANTGKKGQ